MNYRKKPADTVVRQLNEIANIYGHKFIQFTDNIVTHTFLQEKLPICKNICGQIYFMKMKAKLKMEDFISLKSAGVSNIQPGIERLNDEALKLMCKGTSPLVNVRTLRYAVEFGICVHWNILLGFAENRQLPYIRSAS